MYALIYGKCIPSLNTMKLIQSYISSNPKYLKFTSSDITIGLLSITSTGIYYINVRWGFKEFVRKYYSLLTATSHDRQRVKRATETVDAVENDNPKSNLNFETCPFFSPTPFRPQRCNVQSRLWHAQAPVKIKCIYDRARGQI